MRIREEYDFITKTTGRPISNIEQFSFNKQIIIETKNIFVDLFGYSPSIKECVYIIENNLNAPEICLNPNCSNFAKFAKTKYNYCCRRCSDTDINRNKKIQKERSQSNIDYLEIHKKVVDTKNKVGDDGLNIHQRSGAKAIKTRTENYDVWYEAMISGIKNKSDETKKLAAEKRYSTCYEKYGLTHFGGGFSKLKHMTINGKHYIYQGYEDVALYELIYMRGYNVDDIDPCIRYNKHRFKYEYGYYYPDLYIKSERKYLEIKSLYWDERDLYKELKASAIILSGYNYERIIYDNKDRIKEARTFFATANCYHKE